MELYLIRHGETVDNVAGLYAGVRDSALTNYGHDQANRLGQHFAKSNVRFTHIFSSPLHRAAKTAEAIKLCQRDDGRAENLCNAVDITKVPELIEQDFGYYEGKPFHARSNPKRSGREAHRDQHKDEPGFQDVESKESMDSRADKFLDGHLLPLFEKDGAAPFVVGIVSHGMLLSHLWRRLLLRLPPKSVSVDPEVTAAKGSIILQHLGGWSNTGYLELAFDRAAKSEVPQAFSLPATSKQDPTDLVQTATATTSSEGMPASATNSEASTSHDMPQMLNGWSILICAIDRKDHLIGLKRQRGGIGSSAHDKGHKKLDGFFKRQRTS
ncbi:phosphoglycerate mutase [Lecanosticta acicola]|uniref:Phosphoglycerate mutase n=1 Tax=Lecanosticta acicola TaxID=111012 RepID=A0AAI8YXN4_9PEZI|nr:phosphoglycerate mutase [Lecanosticta acicola]